MKLCVADKVRIFLSQTCVNWFKCLDILGWARFRILRYAYKIFWWNSPRNGEWDFVLGWLRPIRKFQGTITTPQPNQPQPIQ